MKSGSSTAACMHLVLNPLQFDTLLLPNLYGDIVSDLCAGLVGGLGLVPSANLGDEVAVFEAVHGTAPDIAGQQKANPTALLLSAVLMLRHLDEGETADRIFAALKHVFTAGRIRTRDLGGTATTREFTEAISREMDGRLPSLLPNLPPRCLGRYSLGRCLPRGNCSGVSRSHVRPRLVFLSVSSTCSAPGSVRFEAPCRSLRCHPPPRR